MGWEWERHSSEECEDHWESRSINHSSGSVSLHGGAVPHYSGGQPVASTAVIYEVTLPTGQERNPPILAQFSKRRVPWSAMQVDILEDGLVWHGKPRTSALHHFPIVQSASMQTCMSSSLLFT